MDLLNDDAYFNIQNHRYGDWMQTFTGRKFWPLDPRPEDFDIYDIAHALSMICRFSGHCIEFYSVAEHTCHIVDRCSPANKKSAALHDAPESYIGDMVSPLKKDFPEFRQIEGNIHYKMSLRFGVPFEIPEEVHRLDKAIVRDELVNMRNVPAEWNIPPVGIGAEIQLWPPKKAEFELLKRFKEVGLI